MGKARARSRSPAARIERDFGRLGGSPNIGRASDPYEILARRRHRGGPSGEGSGPSVAGSLDFTDVANSALLTLLGGFP